MHAIIVETGPGTRYLDIRLSRPGALKQVAGERPAIDWVLCALAEVAPEGPVYVGGYHIEKMIAAYPQLSYRYLPPDPPRGEVAGLLAAMPESGDVIVVGADLVLLQGVLGEVNALDAPVATARRGETHKLPLLRIRADVLPRCRELARGLPAEASLADLVENLRQAGVAVAELDLEGRAASTRDREGTARALFRGKAHALESLAPVVNSAVILDSVRFTVAQWNGDRAGILDRVAARYGGRPVIVRSATLAEDSMMASAAGRFLSLMDVPADDAGALAQAVEQVIASYTVPERQMESGDEVLIQEQIRDLAACGVLFTREPSGGAPYFVITADLSTGRSDVVTSGLVGAVETHYVLQSATEDTDNPILDQVLRMGRELIHLTRLDGLDIEFGIDREGIAYLFQVRPLATLRDQAQFAEEDLEAMVARAKAFVAARMRPNPNLVGATTILGTMPDWNPVEMLGRAPRPLALSLYQEMIGNGTWARARALIGYRDVAPEPLILSLGGRPYVDVRASLNSLLPADLPDAIAERWVNACLERLRANPELHDKLEFEIAITCLAPDWDLVRGRLDEAGLSEAEISRFKDSLRRLTRDIVNGTVEPISRQQAALDRMVARRRRLNGMATDDPSQLVYAAYRALEDCRDLGVLPFSILARYAFIAMSLLRGLVARGTVPPADAEAFQRAVPTVASRFTADLARLGRGELDMAAMLDGYGHLRPNSYEITSPNYRSDPERYFLGSFAPPAAAAEPPEASSILLRHRGEIQAELDALDLEVRAETLVAFIAEAIAAREAAKFEFMKNIDFSLEAMAAFGAAAGLSREVLSFLPVAECRRMATDCEPPSVASTLLRAANFNRKRWRLGECLMLPQLICDPQALSHFKLETWRANFVTRERVVAAPVWLDDGDSAPGDLDGAIVVIRAADPGYDWIFGHRIVGLVTEYGGAGSHMAIRAAEFGLPAAIGCGSAVFDSLREAHLIELDCGREVVRAAR